MMTTLGKKRAEKTAPADKKYKYYTLAELGPLLGLSHATLRMFIKSGRLPAIFLAGKWRVNQAALDDFLAGGDTAAAEPRAERKARKDAKAAAADTTTPAADALPVKEKDGER